MQDTVNGTSLTIDAKFLADGQFQLSNIITDWFGNEALQAIYGTYVVQGNKLMLQTIEGPMQAAFMFRNGYLCVRVEGEETTYMFQRG